MIKKGCRTEGVKQRNVRCIIPTRKISSQSSLHRIIAQQLRQGGRKEVLHMKSWSTKLTCCLKPSSYCCPSLSLLPFIREKTEPKLAGWMLQSTDCLCESHAEGRKAAKRLRNEGAGNVKLRLELQGRVS